MAPPLRWSMTLLRTREDGTRDALPLQFAEGDAVTLGGGDDVLAGGPAEARVQVAADGSAQLEVLAPGAQLDGAPWPEPRLALEPGRVLSLPLGQLSLQVPPFLESGHPPAALHRWALDFELSTGERTQRFSFTRATGERFSLGRHDLNVLRLPSSVLARKHVELFVDWQGVLWAQDCASPGGTWLQAQRVRLAGWTRLSPDDVLAPGGSVTARQLAAPRQLPR